MTEALARNNQAHRDNVAGLANVLPLMASQPLDRVAVANLLMMFRYHESQRLADLRTIGGRYVDDGRMWGILGLLRALIVSRLRAPEEAIS